LALAACLALGAAFDSGHPWWWLCVALGTVALARVRRLGVRWRYALWLLAAVWTGVALRSAVEARANEQVAQAAAHALQTNARVEVVVERVLADHPRPRLRVRVEALHGMDGKVPWQARAVVTLPLGITAPVEGQRLLMRTSLHAPRRRRFPGDLDAKAALGSKGINLVGSVSHADDVVVLRQDDPPATAEHVVFALRARSRALIRRAVPDDAAALVEAFVLGESPWLTDAIRAPFDGAGAAHLLAVSGLQATLLAALLFYALRWLWARSAWLLSRVDPDPAAAVLSLPLIVLYAAYAGGAASVVRSAWMALAVMVGVALRRKGATVQALGLAAILMVALEPRVVMDAGFQLSFLSVLALVLVTPGLLAALGHQDDGTGSARAWLWAALASSTAAYLATLPLTVHLFGRLSVYGAVTNVLLVPMGAVALPFAVVATLLGTALDWVFPVQVAGAVSLAVMDVCKVFAQLPFSVVELPSPGAAVAALGVLGVLVMGAGSKRAAMIGLGLCALALTGLVPRPQPTGVLTVFMVPVGQGDGAIVRFPDGSVGVVDGGGSFISNHDPGASIMAPLLDKMGVKQLDLMILSHPHPDHHNGLVTLARKYKPKQFWWNGQPSRHPRLLALLAALQESGTAVTVFERPAQGASITVQHGGATLDVMHPLPVRDGPDAPTHYPELDDNDNSLVVRITHGGHRILFPGDIEEEAEARLSSDPAIAPLLRADVLKVPHHGSSTSTTDALLNAVAPTIALMGVGERNPWHFPHPDVVARLASHHVDLWRTDEDGLITVDLDEHGVTVDAYAR